MSVLLSLIEKQFTITGRGRYLKTEEHDSLVIDVDRDIFYWNSTGVVGDAFVWLTKIEHKTPSEAKKIIKDLELPDHQVYVEIVTPKGEEVLVYPKLVSIFWENGKANYDYWLKRGITQDTINRFQLGFYQDWYMIPFFMNGTFMNFQMRTDAQQHLKLIKNWYTGVGPILFNSDVLKLATTVVITESPPDAILLNQAGIPAVSHNAGADYWSPTWFKYFINQRRIFIVYDNDKAGRTGADRVAKALGQYRCRVYTFDGYEDKYDLGDWFLDPMNEEKSFMEVLEIQARRIFE